MPSSFGDGPTRVRLRSPADLAAAVPHLVGFHPHESLVAVSLRGPRLRIGLTMRFDLLPEQVNAPVAEEVAARLRHDGARQAFLAVVTDRPGLRPELPHRDLVAEIGLAMREQGVAVQEALLLRAGRFWSYLCDVEECCPAAGRAVPTDGAALDIAAAHALNGRGLLPSREALVTSIAPLPIPARAGMEQALERAGDAIADPLDRGSVAAARAETVRLFSELVRRYVEPTTARVTDDEAARLIVGLHDVAARDALLPLLLEADDDVLLPLLSELCRRAIPPSDAPVSTVLGLVAYASGAGALAGIAFERALTSDPSYSFARLLQQGLGRQVPPAALRQAALRALVGARRAQAS